MDEVDDILEHFGIKGMKWGRRKRTHSQDAARAKKFQDIAKKQGAQALSNKDLQTLVTRMNLDQQYSRLANPKKESKIKNGLNFAKSIIGIGKTMNEAVAFANSPTGKFMGNQFRQRASRSAHGPRTRRYSQAIASLNP